MKRKKKWFSPLFITFPTSISNFPPSLYNFPSFPLNFNPFFLFSLPLFSPIRQQKFPGQKSLGGTLPTCAPPVTPLQKGLWIPVVKAYTITRSCTKYHSEITGSYCKKKKKKKKKMALTVQIDHRYIEYSVYICQNKQYHFYDILECMSRETSFSTEDDN